MKRVSRAVRTAREMLVDMHGLSQLSAQGMSLFNSGDLMFSASASAQRNGVQVWAKVFHASCPNEQKLTSMLLAASLYDLWSTKCVNTFSAGYWTAKAAIRMLKAVEAAVADGAPIHPAVAELTANVQVRISKLPKPIDMHIDDIKHPLKMAIKKGASREDLIRLVDEAIAESVMGA